MTKNKLNVIMDQKEPTLADHLTDHPALQWASKNATNILAGAALVFAALFFIYRMSASDQTQAENDYFTAAKDFNTFVKADDTITPIEREEAFAELGEVLQRRPNLQQKYDAMVAQALLTKERAGQALPYADRTFKRISKDNLPMYEDFAKITLLIGQGDYTQALDLTKSLKEKLQAKDEPVTSLSTYNLIRLAMLEQSLGNHTEELKAWEELNASLYTPEAMLSPSANEQRALFENIFSDGNLSLKNYVDHREKQLRSTSKKTD